MGVVTVGSVKAGTAASIMPGESTMEGTIRSNAPEIRETINEALPVMVENTAAAHHVHAKVDIARIMPVTMNDAELTEAMLPALQRAAYGNAQEIEKNQAASEDFAYFAEKVPGLYVFLGVTPEDQDLSTAPSNHHPVFLVDEVALVTGVLSHVEFVLEYSKWKADHEKSGAVRVSDSPLFAASGASQSLWEMLLSLSVTLKRNPRNEC